jgi:hypothetical protein
VRDFPFLYIYRYKKQFLESNSKDVLIDECGSPAAPDESRTLWMREELSDSAFKIETHLQSHTEQLTEKELSIIKSLSISENEGERIV